VAWKKIASREIDYCQRKQSKDGVAKERNEGEQALRLD